MVTRAKLQNVIDDIRKELEEQRSRRQAAESEMRSAHEAAKQARAQFADLKERLANAEAENQRMRGYIARVQEDDVVREELILVGEADGEQRLAPKRKATTFGAPDAYQHFTASRDEEFSGMACGRIERRGKPRHWITY
jgi:chromosome segregation ATPase